MGIVHIITLFWPEEETGSTNTWDDADTWNDATTWED